MPAQRRWALVAGLACLAMTVIALATAFDPVAALVPVDPVDGYDWPEGLQDQVAALFIGSAVIVLLDIVIALALVPLFPLRQGLAIAMAVARVVYAAGYAFALLHLLNAVSATRDIVDVGTLAAARAGAEGYRTTWDLAFYAFGAHLALLGALLWSGTMLRRLLAVLLLIAGAGYVVDSTLALAMPKITLRVAPVTFLGEMALLLWLLGKAGRPGRN